MYTGPLIFSQIMDHLPWHCFRRCVQRYQGNRYVKRFACSDQYRCMAFAQLTYRESLRDIEACLRAQQNKLYHIGIRARVSRSTLADANELRDWRIYADFAQSLIRTARRLYAEEDLGLELDNTVYALDATMIDLCLSMFPWAQYKKTKGAIKLHTLLDLRGNIPTFLHISSGKLYDVHALDLLLPEPGAFYVMDRGYVDFRRLYALHTAGAFFLIRPRSNLQYRRRYSHFADRSIGVLADQTVALTGVETPGFYPQSLRRIRYHDPNNDKTLVFLTNNFAIPARTVADLYRYRWQVELFFKWIKQHLRIRTFFGTNPNAVKTQIWIAVSVYVLIAILKKRLHLQASLYTILQILSLTIFERIPLDQVLTNVANPSRYASSLNQLNLFDI
jgi:hypothetical protein